MKNQPKTVIDTLCERLCEQAKRFNPSLESAPVAVLWTDERRAREGVLPQLKSALPELFSLGNYQPQDRTGPDAWLRMVADGQAGGGHRHASRAEGPSPFAAVAVADQALAQHFLYAK